MGWGGQVQGASQLSSLGPNVSEVGGTVGPCEQTPLSPASSIFFLALP